MHDCFTLFCLLCTSVFFRTLIAYEEKYILWIIPTHHHCYKLTTSGQKCLMQCSSRQRCAVSNILDWREYNIEIKLKLIGFSLRMCLHVVHGKFFLLLVMQNMYRKAAEFWAEFRLELLSAGELFAEGISNQIWRLYWASHQVLSPYIFGNNFYQTSFAFPIFSPFSGPWMHAF